MLAYCITIFFLWVVLMSFSYRLLVRDEVNAFHFVFGLCLVLSVGMSFINGYPRCANSWLDAFCPIVLAFPLLSLLHLSFEICITTAVILLYGCLIDFLLTQLH
jgi:hypothetical protein